MSPTALEQEWTRVMEEVKAIAPLLMESAATDRGLSPREQMIKRLLFTAGETEFFRGLVWASTKNEQSTSMQAPSGSQKIREQPAAGPLAAGVKEEQNVAAGGGSNRAMSALAARLFKMPEEGVCSEWKRLRAEWVEAIRPILTNTQMQCWVTNYYGYTLPEPASSVGKILTQAAENAFYSELEKHPRDVLADLQADFDDWLHSRMALT